MKKVLPLLSVLLVLSCLGRRGDAAASQSETTQTNIVTPGKIVIPEVPVMIVTDEEKADYLMLHYWDNFDFTDTTYIHFPDITEQAFVDYVSILGLVSPLTARASIGTVVDRSAGTPQMFGHFDELFEKYLDDPNSPFRNEELYILVLENVIASDKIEEVYKIRPEARLKTALKNRVGTRAADFTVTDENGRKLSLHKIDAQYTILYFNNPDCNYCEEVTMQLRGSEDMIMPLVRQNVLKILAVYPDEDLTAWREHLGDMPREWYRTYDASLAIRNDGLYDLRAIPSLYLLSQDKTVLLKDIDKVYIIEHYLAQQGY